jgi:hypothetical protein
MMPCSFCRAPRQRARHGVADLTAMVAGGAGLQGAPAPAGGASLAEVRCPAYHHAVKLFMRRRSISPCLHVLNRRLSVRCAQGKESIRAREFSRVQCMTKDHRSGRSIARNTHTSNYTPLSTLFYHSSCLLDACVCAALLDSVAAAVCGPTRQQTGGRCHQRACTKHRTAGAGTWGPPPVRPRPAELASPPPVPPPPAAAAAAPAGGGAEPPS